MSAPSSQRELRANSRMFACASVSMLALGSSAAWAQSPTTTTSSGQIKEIVVTAERRAQNLQKVAASVEVRKGTDLEAEGRITTTQILEDVPNVTVGAPASGDNPNGNITIRGVQNTQQTGGGPGPSATATYVDDVFQGIGGDYDINQVEVLRGPQGTLYGRSATGGVVAFHTNDPVLGKFSGSITGEVGSYDLRQAVVAVNIPILDVLAIRVAAREFDQEGYYNELNKSTEDQEARVKVLYKPLSNLRFLASWSINEQHAVSGGDQQTLVNGEPNTIDFDHGALAVATAESREHQYMLNTNYDFGFGNFTWIAALHDFDQNGATGSFAPPQGGIISGFGYNPLDQFHTEELRIQNDPGSTLTWLLGGNFYSNAFKNNAISIQTLPAPGGPPNFAPDTYEPANLLDGAFLFGNPNSGLTTDWGAFTEETYPVLDNLRITGGARFDETRVEKTSTYLFNKNIDGDFNSYSPTSLIVPYPSLTSVNTFTNFTFKARAEYDLTPTNLLYGMVATGFLPGDAQISPQVAVNFHASPPTASINFIKLPFEQERLTSFEAGSKNRFLDNTLQVNGDVFYYKYSGYQEAVNVAAGGPIPEFVILAVPVKMFGIEFDGIYRLTPDDRFEVNGGYLDATITGYPNVPQPNVSATATISGRNYAQFSRLPGIPPLNVNFSYDHTFELPDGSTLVPRTEIRYTGGMYISQATAFEAYGGMSCNPGGCSTVGGSLAYDRVGAEVVADIGATWNSANSMYSATVYANNVTNNIYKSAVQLSSNGPSNLTVTPSNPRVVGVILAAKF